MLVRLWPSLLRLLLGIDPPCRHVLSEWSKPLSHGHGVFRARRCYLCGWIEVQAMHHRAADRFTWAGDEFDAHRDSRN